MNACSTVHWKLRYVRKWFSHRHRTVHYSSFYHTAGIRKNRKERGDQESRFFVIRRSPQSCGFFVWDESREYESSPKITFSFSCYSLVWRCLLALVCMCVCEVNNVFWLYTFWVVVGVKSIMEAWHECS